MNLLRLILIAIAGAAFIGPVRSGEEWKPPTEVCTPDRAHCVRFLRKALPGAPEGEDATIEIVAHGRTLARYATFGYILNGFWGPDEKYVAFNNRRANAGDYLWVLSGTDGAIIKMPDDLAKKSGKEKAGSIKGDDHVLPMDKIHSLCPQCQEDDIKKLWAFTTGWKSPTELMVVVEFAFMHVDGSIDLMERCKIDGEQLSLIDRTVERPDHSLRP